jgi:hypothetical protein
LEPKTRPTLRASLVAYGLDLGDQAKTATAGMSEREVTDLIDEAVQWTREH